MKRLAFLAVLLTPLLALADAATVLIGTAPQVAVQADLGLDMKGSLLAMFIQYVLPTLVTGVGTLLMALIGFAMSWLKTKAAVDAATGQASLKYRVLSEFAHYMEVAATNAEQTFVVEAKEACKDGKLTAVEGKKIKDRVIAEATKNMGESGMAALATVLGGTGPGAHLVEGYASSLAETLARKVSAASTPSEVTAPAPAGGSIIDGSKPVAAVPNP